MPGHGLGAVDLQFVGVVAEDFLQSPGLADVAERGGCPVGVDIVDVLRGDAGTVECVVDRLACPRAVLLGSGHVVGIAADSRPRFRQDRYAAFFGGFFGLQQDQDPPPRPSRSRHGPHQGREARCVRRCGWRWPFSAMNPASASGMDGRFAAAGQDHVGVTFLEQVECNVQGRGCRWHRPYSRRSSGRKL